MCPRCWVVFSHGVSVEFLLASRGPYLSAAVAPAGCICLLSMIKAHWGHAQPDLCTAPDTSSELPCFMKLAAASSA